MDTEIGECGFSAHELQTGYSLLQEPDATLAPFMVPRGLPQTDLVAKLFSNFREMAGIFNRHKEKLLTQQVEGANRNRHLRQLSKGEIVFRKLPPKARQQKHWLGVPSQGPYEVVRQTTFNSAQLRDPATGEMVDGAADIPLEQILVGPRRSMLQFEESGHDRSLGQMIEGKVTGLPEGVVATGYKPSKTKGWRGLVKGHVIVYRTDGSRELSVAMVDWNNRNEDSVVAVSHRTIWVGTTLVHKKEYRRTDTEGVEVVLEPTGEEVKLTIQYVNIVRKVELQQTGRMFQGDSTALAKGGWKFRVDQLESGKSC